ncbi:MAG: hypothetical protein HY303_18140 [Candidatus Wallbacteria bacterium]|nr:hypothetical protein [Candidatus Wallbacteria bacterium]
MPNRLLLVLALLALASPLVRAQSRGALGRQSLSERDLAERLRRGMLSDLADTFPAARVRVDLEERRVRMTIEVDTPGMSASGISDVLETVKNLAASNVELHAPGYQLAADATFAARDGGRITTRRAADLGGPQARATRKPAIEPGPQALPQRLAKPAKTAARPEPSTVDELAPAPAPQDEGTPLELLDELSGKPRKPVAGTPSRKARKGKLDGKTAGAMKDEDDALRRERADLARLDKGKRAARERPWEKMKVPIPPASPPAEYVPALVRADLIDLPTARIAPRHQVLAHSVTSFRDFGGRVYGNVAKASQRLQELDFRIGLTNRLEARVRPYFSDLDITPRAAGSFSSTSSDQGSASFGLRYRLPWHEKLFHMAVGIDAGIVQETDRQYLLPDDFERLRDVYFVLSHPGADDASWHVAASWTPLDVPTGTPDNSLLKIGAGTDYRLSKRLRLLAEAVYKSLDVSTAGRFGAAVDPSHLDFNLGLRTAFRFATVDLYARRLFVEDFTDWGVAVRTSL